MPLTRGNEYVVQVKVEDRNAQVYLPQMVKAEIVILAGRRPPQFYEANYKASVLENMPPSE